MENHLDKSDWINFAEYPELAATAFEAENAEQQATYDWNTSKYVDIQQPRNFELPQDLFDDLFNTANLTETNNQEPFKQDAAALALDVFDWDAFLSDEALALPSSGFSPSAFPFSLEQTETVPKGPQSLTVDTSGALHEHVIDTRPDADTIPIPYDPNDFIDWNDITTSRTDGNPQDVWTEAAQIPQETYQPSYEYPEPPVPNTPFPIESLYSPSNLRRHVPIQTPPRREILQQREVENRLLQQPKPQSHISPSIEPHDPNIQSIPYTPNPYKHNSERLAAPQYRSKQFEASFGVGSQISYDRRSKKVMDPNCDPSHFYTASLPQLQPWGPILPDGCPLFTYLPQGQLNPSREYTRSQIRDYVRNCPRQLVAWVQQAPAQCNHRLTPTERKCRYTHCPDHNRSILPGWLRVAFDESPELTSNGDKDPFKIAMVMHLWCFEQCFDAMELYKDGKLLPENRQFLRETKNPMAITKNSDAKIISEAFEPWIEQRSRHWLLNGPLRQPRKYEDSLSFALVSYHVDNQIQSRQNTRLSRNAAKSKDNWNTIDVHKGDLSLYAERSRRRAQDVQAKKKASRRHKKVTQRRHRERNKAPASDFDVYEYHPSPTPILNQCTAKASYYDPTLPPEPMPVRASVEAFNCGGLVLPGAQKSFTTNASNMSHILQEKNDSQRTPEHMESDADSLFG